MKKLLCRTIMGIVLVLSVSALMADFRTIGPGTNHTGNYEPWGSQEGYHRCAQLYLASELGNMGSITTYACNPHSTKESIDIPLKIYMKMTTATSISASATFNSMKTGATLVYTGTIFAIHGGEWNSVTLNTPFDYTGGNLLIITESNCTSSGHANAVYHFTTSTNRNWYYRVNNTPPTGNETGTLNSNRAGIQLGINNFPPVPNPAVATNPLPSATLMGPTFNFTWTAPTSGTPPLGYKVYLGTNNPPTNLVSGTDLGNVLSYTYGSAFNAGTTYYWKIIPYSIAGDCTSATVWSFSTQPAVTAIATNPSPANGAVSVLTNASLSWDAVANATSYDIYYGSPISTTPVATVTGTSWTPPIMTNDTNYSWKIVPKNVFGATSGTPEVWSFTSVVPAPLAAVLVSPVNGGVGILKDASLDWTPNSSGYAPTGYNLYFGTNYPPTNLVNGTDIGNVTTFTPGTDLLPGTTYYWETVPYNAGGSCAAPTIGSFTTEQAVTGIAGNPSPTDDATSVATDASLYWDAVANATSYDVYFGSPLSETPVATVTGTSWTPPAMDNGTAYSWKIVPKNSFGVTSGTPEVWTFDTIIAAPEAVVLVSPATPATDVADNPTFTWTPSETGTAPTGYKFYFGTDNPPTSLIDGTDLGNILTYTPGADLLHGTTYYWEVVPYNEGGDCPAPTFGSFTTEQAVTGIAGNPSPTDDATSVATGASLSWDAVANATAYDVYFGSPLSETPVATVTGTSWTPPAMDNGTAYSWKIVPKNSFGVTSGTPEVWTFDTIIAAPAPVILLTPTEAATDIAQVPTFTWTPAETGTAPTGYKFYIGTDNPPTDLVEAIDLGNVRTYTLGTDLLPATTYYWEVVSYNAGGEAVGSTISSFSTDDTVGPPYLTITPDYPETDQMSSVNVTGARLDWNVVRGATSYKIYASADPYSDFSTWTFLAEVPTNYYIDSVEAGFKFYRVSSVCSKK